MVNQVIRMGVLNCFEELPSVNKRALKCCNSITGFFKVQRKKIVINEIVQIDALTCCQRVALVIWY